MTYCATILFASTIGLFAASTSAMADIYEATYTGTASGVDTNGVFGTAGATLNNVAYTSTYTYDLSQFGNAVVYSGTGVVYVYGGSNSGRTDPILSASISVNGSTYGQSSSYYGREQLAGPSAPQGTVSLSDYAEGSQSNYLIDSVSTIGLVTPSLTALQSFAIPSGSGNGRFVYNGEFISLNETYFALTDIGSSSPTAAPEPASLALLAGSAGLFAAALGTCRKIAGRRIEGQSGA